MIKLLKKIFAKEEKKVMVTYICECKDSWPIGTTVKPPAKEGIRYKMEV